MKPCVQWTAFLGISHPEETLSPSEYQAFQAHLAECSDCATRHTEYQEMRQFFRMRSTVRPLPDQLPDLIRSKVSQEDQQKHHPRESIFIQSLVALLAFVTHSLADGSASLKSMEIFVRRSPLARGKNILGVIGAFTLAAFSGIIGNRAGALVTQVWPLIEAIVVTNLAYWSILLVCIGICICLWLRSQMWKQAFTTDHKMLSLDDSLLRVLASWVPSQNAEQENKRILTDLLLDAMAEFDGQVQRAALLRPDVLGEYLRCWANYQMSQESIDHMKFYIGPEEDRRQKEGGVAGEVFLRGELQVGHLHRQVNGTWTSEDCPSYLPFPGRRPSSPYRSFVNVPIIGIDPNVRNSSHTTCLGVICFDSMHHNVFDSKERQEVLRILARRVAAALLIFRIYRKLATPLAGGSSSSVSSSPFLE